eukprot:jgi/Chrzof1/1587/Cz10g13150.t1
MSAALRQAVQELRKEVPKLARSFKSSTAPQSKPPGYHYDYEHGPHYLDFQNWPGRHWKVPVIISTMLVTGVGVPVFAVWWQQKKLRG